MVRHAMLPRLVLLQCAFAAVLAVGSDAAPPPNRVAAGDVTPSSAVLWTRSDVAGPVVFIYAPLDSDGQLLADWEIRAVNVLDPSIPAKVDVIGLMPGTLYVHAATTDLGASFDVGFFRTPHLVGTHHGLRFGVSGDARGELGPFPALRNAPARDLDFFVVLGDSIYADVPSEAVPTNAVTPEEFRAKHEEIVSERFGLNSLGDLRAVTALFATIDDHEVRNDFAGGAHPSTDSRFPYSTEQFINETALYAAGLEAFHQYYPIREEFNDIGGDPRTSEKRRLYRARQFGSDAAIFMLDARSFRDEPLISIDSFDDIFNLIEFLVGTFDPSRTMLGADQLARLEADLLDAEQMGITWKFVLVPEPIQNMGVLLASDRFEGYAAERTQILSFIEQENIQNVVFIAADLHGTLINNLAYQTEPLGAQNFIDSFEVVTGPIAYDAPLGPTTVEAAVNAGILDQEFQDFYESLNRAEKDYVVELLGNVQMGIFGYDPFGLEGSSIEAELTAGRYVAAHVYGWTEFVVDAESQQLTVTVWGIDPYTADDLANDPAGVLARVPEVVTRFTVNPH